MKLLDVIAFELPADEYTATNAEWQRMCEKSIRIQHVPREQKTVIINVIFGNQLNGGMARFAVGGFDQADMDAYNAAESKYDWFWNDIYDGALKLQIDRAFREGVYQNSSAPRFSFDRFAPPVIS